jgi:hypothetical protein
MEAPQHAGTERTGVSSAPAGEDAESSRVRPIPAGLWTVPSDQVRAALGTVNSFHAEARTEGRSADNFSQRPESGPLRVARQDRVPIVRGLECGRLVRAAVAAGGLRREEPVRTFAVSRVKRRARAVPPRPCRPVQAPCARGGTANPDRHRRPTTRRPFRAEASPNPFIDIVGGTRRDRAMPAPGGLTARARAQDFFRGAGKALEVRQAASGSSPGGTCGSHQHLQGRRR